ncbi:cytosol leucyl aminopeptidase [Tanacetum coccineum]
MIGNSVKEVAEQILSSFIVAACENMIGGTRMRPGDKVTASNGKTIEAATIVDDNSDVVLFGEETEAEKKAAE